VAGRTSANVDHVLALRFQPELGVKGQDPKDLAGWHACPFADAVNGFFWDISQLFLHLLQERN
jgi:hypothetical protein